MGQKKRLEHADLPLVTADELELERKEAASEAAFEAIDKIMNRGVSYLTACELLTGQVVQYAYVYGSINERARLSEARREKRKKRGKKR